MKELPNIDKIPYYLGSFDINYIVFRNVEIFRFIFFQRTIVERNIEFQE
jgi:hypothetical protein